MSNLLLSDTETSQEEINVFSIDSKKKLVFTTLLLRYKSIQALEQIYSRKKRLESNTLGTSYSFTLIIIIFGMKFIL